MPSEAVLKKHDYLIKCLREGPLRDLKDPELDRLVDHTSEDMLSTVDEERALSTHMVRFVETYIRIKRYVKPSSRTAIVEAGTLSLLSRFMVGAGYGVSPCLGDFRYALEGKSESADVLFAFEVFEHIKDQDSTFISDIDIFNFSGINRFLQECRRLLQKAGVLVITTPNACSLRSLVNFYPHVKEYAPQDVIELCAKNGLRLVQFETFFAYYYLGSDRPKVWDDYIVKAGFSPEHRGDCSFFIFCRDDFPGDALAGFSRST